MMNEGEESFLGWGGLFELLISMRFHERVFFNAGFSSYHLINPKTEYHASSC